MSRERYPMQSNIGFILSRTSRKYANKTALIFRERRLTYRELNSRVNRLTNALIGLGVGKGTKVGLIFNNCNEFVESIYAILKAQGVVVPINTRLSYQEISFLLDHSDVSVLIFDNKFIEKVAVFWETNPKIKHYIVCDEESCPGFLHYETLLQSGSSEEPSVSAPQEEDEACIIYTAGTTGRPKGVVLTHRNFIWLAVNYCIGGMTSFEDVSLYIFPLYHVGGLGTYIAHTFIGATAVLKEKYDPLDCLETIQMEGINRWSAIPSIYAEIVNHPDIGKYNLKSITKLSSGAAPMPVDLKYRLAEIFPNAGILDGYGQTESAGAITMLSAKDALKKPGSVGLPYPTNEIRVVDEDDADVPVGEVGELVYQGYTRMSCYYKDPEATAEALKGGWMHSGDLVRLDEEGYVYLVDRKRDMIITGGENVYCREVEETIARLPGVEEVAVVGLPDPKWGEAVTAIVVPRPGAYLSHDEIIDYCKTQIAGYKAPKRVIFAEHLPKNSVGKVLKSELKEIYAV
ncbi:MAG: hypothetical protein DRG63_08840 [Deltaproteobacteria bacterium]|nr:MAG: hypothetical protein DRG63_08840 [Deltaproteobacteria bacterium]